MEQCLHTISELTKELDHSRLVSAAYLKGQLKLKENLDMLETKYQERLAYQIRDIERVASIRIANALQDSILLRKRFGLLPLSEEGYFSLDHICSKKTERKS